MSGMKMLLTGLTLFEGGLLQGKDLFQAFLLGLQMAVFSLCLFTLSSFHAHLYLCPHLPLCVRTSVLLS